MAGAKNGYHIEAAGESLVYGVKLDKNSNFKVTDDGRLVVVNAIGDPNAHGGGGKMDAGSLLEAADFLELWGGVQKASGTLRARLRSITTHDPSNTPRVETLEAAINQNAADPLVLEAHDDVMAGGINADTITAGRDVISGSVSANGTTPAEGHIFLNAGGDGFHYPRAPITASAITALAETQTDKDTYGRVIAGELNMPRQTDKSASLTAQHLMTLKHKAEGSLPASSGDFTMQNGEFGLKSAAHLSYQIGDGKTVGTSLATVHLDYASYVGGNMTLTDVKGSFTNLRVVNKSDVSGGSLIGSIENSILKTVSANFDKVSEVNLNTLEVDEDFTATANGDSSVNKTVVGGAASVTGGSYTGSEFAAKKKREV